MLTFPSGVGDMVWDLALHLWGNILDIWFKSCLDVWAMSSPQLMEVMHMLTFPSGVDDRVWDLALHLSGYIARGGLLQCMVQYLAPN